MRIFAMVVMLLFSTLVFNAGTADTAYAQPSKKKASQASQNKNKTKKVTIKKGDTLTKIAKKYKTTYPRLFYANKHIKDPDVIYPGDKIRVPSPKEKLKKRPFYQKPVTKPVKKTVRKPTVNNPAPAPTQSKPAPKPTYSSNTGNGVWERLAQCESGGNWSINTGNGYYGGLQFNIGTWRANGGSGYPHQSSKAEQIRVAKNLHASRGFLPWPACSAKLGIR